MVERAKPEIPVLANISNLHAAIGNPFHQRCGGGDLPEGVVVEVEMLRQGRPDDVGHAFTGAGTVGLQGMPVARRQAQIHVVARCLWGRCRHAQSILGF